MAECLNRRRLLARGAVLAGAVVTAPLQRAMGRPAAGATPVAVVKCDAYEAPLLAGAFRKMLDLIGGIDRLVRGKTVTIKLNLTGGPRWKVAGLPAHRTYHVHPNFVAAACAAIHDAGARRIILVESGYDRRPLDQVMAAGGWSISSINAAGGWNVAWEDTRNQGIWKSYSRLSVPWGGYLYPAFDLNRRYEKTDVFISLAKLKDHANAGITASVKNLFGIAPTSLYGDNYDGAGKPACDEQSVTARGATFHKGDRGVPDGVPPEHCENTPRDWRHRVPRVTADLFGARPVDLCLVDGIETIRGGEGPWIRGVEPLRPGLIFAGRDGVATDAVCAAAMGYEPEAPHRSFPFPGENHLTLLADKDVGVSTVGELEVLGCSLAESVHPFNPDRREIGAPIFQ